MKLETSIMIADIITTLIRDNVDVHIEQKGMLGRTTRRRVEFNSFKPISELLTNERRTKVMTMISRILGIEIWATDYVNVEKTIETGDLLIGPNLNTDEICKILTTKIEKGE